MQLTNANIQAPQKIQTVQNVRKNDGQSFRHLKRLGKGDASFSATKIAQDLNTTLPKPNGSYSLEKI